jgi:hypothetical protein
MLAGAVMDRPSSFGQAERSVNGNEVGLCLMDHVQDVFIAERNVRVSPQAAKETHTGRTARRTREVYADNDKRFFAAHSIRPQFTFLAL